VAEVAAESGVSKPVLYRYFADKDELHGAVGQWAADQVLARMMPPLLAAAPMRERVARATDGYLSLLDEHPHVFALLVRHRTGGSDPLADGKARIAAAFARVLGEMMRELGLDTGGAEPWAQGLVGLGLATGEWWLERRTMTRAAIGAYLTSFIWHAIEGTAAELGVPLSSLDSPTAVPEVTRLEERR